MAATATQRATFLQKVAPIAIRQAKKHGDKLYPSVCLAQAIHESGWGTSKKMVRANALYGIKVGKSAYHFGNAWDGDAYNTVTTEYYDANKQIATKITDWFRAYKDIESATEDYMDMLCHCQRYKKALNQSSPYASIKAIVDGGYATGPDYVTAIMNIISVYNLTKYDCGEILLVNPYERRTSLMKVGSRGESVKWLQWELNRRGAKLKEDGIYGEQTKLAVLLYQKDHGLVQDGICGPVTIKYLENR